VVIVLQRTGCEMNDIDEMTACCTFHLRKCFFGKRLLLFFFLLSC